MNFIPEAIIDIFQYLPFQNIISCRRINKQFEYVLAFDIACVEGEVFLRYNFKSIQNIIKQQITPTMKGFIGIFKP